MQEPIRRDLLRDLFLKVIRCTTCPLSDGALMRDDQFNLPQPGYVGRNYAGSRVLLVGQNPGISSHRFAAQDARYADLLDQFGRTGADEDFDLLLECIRDIIPTWPIHESYFPLAKSDLDIDDIAFINLVRCRSHGNSKPSAGMSRNCVFNHLRSWIAVLKPECIIAIGKWPFERIPQDIRSQYSGRISFVNRQRSLSSDERARNRCDVIELVRRNRSAGITDATARAPVLPSKPMEPTPAAIRVPSPVAKESASGSYQIREFSKSGRFSHWAILLNGETIAHISPKSVHLQWKTRRLHRPDETKRILRQHSCSVESTGEGDRFWLADVRGVHLTDKALLRRFCELMGISEVPSIH